MFCDDVHLGNHMLLHADSFPKNDIICTKIGIKCLNRLGVSDPHGRPQLNECTVHDKLQQWHNICNCAELSAHSVEDFWTMVSHMVFERFCLLPWFHDDGMHAVMQLLLLQRVARCCIFSPQCYQRH